MKIGVVGAGISGLTFAAAMRRFSPATKVELYERFVLTHTVPQEWVKKGSPFSFYSAHLNDQNSALAQQNQYGQ